MVLDKRTEWRIQFHKALANPERLRIVELLEQGEMCQCDIYPAIGLAFPSCYLAFYICAETLASEWSFNQIG